jgi:hypothetical protein
LHCPFDAQSRVRSLQRRLPKQERAQNERLAGTRISG